MGLGPEYFRESPVTDLEKEWGTHSREEIQSLPYFEWAMHSSVSEWMKGIPIEYIKEQDGTVLVRSSIPKREYGHSADSNQYQRMSVEELTGAIDKMKKEVEKGMEARQKLIGELDQASKGIAT